MLPSKIFEYAALGKPVIAGLGGYSAQFIRDNVVYGCVFAPGDADMCVSCIENTSAEDITQEAIDGFVAKYSRSHIMDAMSNHILSVIIRSPVNAR